MKNLGAPNFSWANFSFLRIRDVVRKRGNTRLKSARLIYRGIHIPKGSCGREKLQVLFVHFVEPLRNGFDPRLVDLSVCDLFRYMAMMLSSFV